jgi:hypothetical protein
MVCDACGTAACWNGDLYCEDYRTAGIRPATIERSSPGSPGATLERGWHQGEQAEQRRVLALLDDPDLVEAMAHAHYRSQFPAVDDWDEGTDMWRALHRDDMAAALDVLRARIEGDR